MITPVYTSFECPYCKRNRILKCKLPVAVCCDGCGFSYKYYHTGTSIDTHLRSKLFRDPFQLPLGTTGKVNALSFEIIGHIRMVTSSGILNDYYILLSNNTYGWLTESNNWWSVILESNACKLLLSTKHKVGTNVSMDGTTYVTTQISKQLSFSFTGEVPEEVIQQAPQFMIEYQNINQPLTFIYEEICTNKTHSSFIGHIYTRKELDLKKPVINSLL